MSDATVAVVYEGGNHFTICTCEPGYGEHYDILERLQGQDVTVEYVYEKARQGLVARPITGRWHCERCRPDGDSRCERSRIFCLHPFHQGGE